MAAFVRQCRGSPLNTVSPSFRGFGFIGRKMRSNSENLAWHATFDGKARLANQSRSHFAGSAMSLCHTPRQLVAVSADLWMMSVRHGLCNPKKNARGCKPDGAAHSISKNRGSYRRIDQSVLILRKSSKRNDR